MDRKALFRHPFQPENLHRQRGAGFSGGTPVTWSGDRLPLEAVRCGGVIRSLALRSTCGREPTVPPTRPLPFLWKRYNCRSKLTALPRKSRMQSHPGFFLSARFFRAEPFHQSGFENPVAPARPDSRKRSVSNQSVDLLAPDSQNLLDVPGAQNL